MRLEPRVEKLEAAIPPGKQIKHVILATDGREGAALDEYGRDKIGKEDEVLIIVLVAGKRRTLPWLV